MTTPCDGEAPLDHEVVARVLRRASELARTVESPDGSAGIAEAILIAAADEVGLPAAAVRRSIAMERLGPLPPARRGDRLFGASVVSVDDEISATVGDVLHRLDGWMVDGHHLRRDRLRAGEMNDQSHGHGEWSKRSGVVGMAIRTIRGATGEGQLGELQRVTATANDTGVGTCVVRVTADRSRDRQNSAGGGAAVAAGGTAGVVVAAVVATPFLLLATPVAVVAGIGVAARGKARANRTRREIQRLLDAIEQGGDPTRLRVDVVRRVSGSVRPPLG